MEEFSSAGAGYRHYGHYGTSNNMYVVRASNHFTSPYGTYAFNKPASPPPAPEVSSPSPWCDCRQIKRRKRIAKYKLFAVEGKLDAQLNKGKEECLLSFVTSSID
ncbi:hypothetical protein M9H77_27398 [Catharanthus roseus]|uniref:Uncharacterized protein n=1 Tax=Catharanthus roseus TaxID=4058 RepID=A0ACC0AE13_CATRO|nr:hypothetical protein M9H77_27398 [Catharanthus roseus]